MQRGSLFWGTILVLGGLIFLADNLGLLGNLNIWNLIWPLFLIALGIWTLWGTVFRRAPEVEHASVPLEGASRARLRVGHGAGRLEIHAGAGPEFLLVGDFYGGLEKDVRRQGDLLDVHLKLPMQVFPIFGWPGTTLDWKIGINPGVPLSLNLDTGANESRLDLSGLQVSEVHLKSGASSTHLILPEHAGMTRARVESGAASLNIDVPQGVGARIHTRGGISTVNVSQRFPRQGDYYVSPDYDTAGNKVELDIDMGVGSVTIR
jgi:hypothetical protein